MMCRERMEVIVWVVVASVLALLLEASMGMAKRLENQDCLPSSCGNIRNISHPFRFKGDPPQCGLPDLELGCENNRATLFFSSTKYYVQNISYDRKSIRLVDADLVVDDYCSIPRKSFPQDQTEMNFYDGRSHLHFSFIMAMYFFTCQTPVVSFRLDFVNYTTCLNTSSPSQTFLYFAFEIVVEDIPDSCNITLKYPLGMISGRLVSISDVHRTLMWGFELEWDEEYGRHQVTLKRRIRWLINGINFKGLRYDLKIGDYYDFFNIIGHTPFWLAIEGYFLTRMLVGILCLMVLFVYRFRRRHLSLDDSIENFLQSHNNFMPIRYSFSEIKAMTKGFKDKLGKGGYGTVFKAKLRSGHLVAVKLLGNSSKSNGQDFISEVATIGRIHHVNVVPLVGFCAEGSKRALVYDFMPNGSLDKFIFSQEEIKVPLSWERIYEIALGVARGIEYLHQGCDMQILHFDIKPHNILLDENFVPKVSDFGLAKLYSQDDSIVSLTAARGTLGYIAPELFYKTIGRVSYKADVYSFGMLLMEMVGRRRNVNKFAEHSSQIYFPHWTYDRICQGDDAELGDATEELKKLVKKMTLVALWCIQMKPIDRPSMNQVLKMLEGEVELLQMPPKPSFHPQDNQIEDHEASSSSYTSYTDVSTTS